MSGGKNPREKVADQLRRIGRRLLNSNFQRVHLGPSSIYAKAYDISKPFAGISTNELDPFIAEAFRRHFTTQPQQSYFFDFQHPGVIDPQIGWLLSSNRLIVESVPYAMEFGIGNPSFFAYRFKRKRRVHFAEAASISYDWANYWHFFNDALGQLCMMDDFQVPFDTPIVVPECARRVPFVQQAFRRTDWLSGRRWIFRDDDTWVQADRWYFSKCHPLKYLHRIVDHLRPPSPKNATEKRIFVSRRHASQRRIENRSEIEAIAEAAGLMIIEPSSLSFDDQMSIFSKAELVVGPHGAGLTNILFRGDRSLLLFELFPEDWIGPHYFLLSRLFNQRYSAMTCSRLVNSGFWVDPKEFRSRLAGLLTVLAVKPSPDV